MKPLYATFEPGPDQHWVQETLPDGSVINYIREYNPRHPKALNKVKPQGTEEEVEEGKALAVGEEVWRIAPNGNRVSRTWVYESTDSEGWIEWAPARRANAKIVRNFDFRPSMEDLERERKRERAEKFLSGLVEAAMDRGLDPEDALDQLAGAGLTLPEKRDRGPYTGYRGQEGELGVPPADEMPFKVEHVGGGWYDVVGPDGKVNEKKLRKAVAKEVAGRLNAEVVDSY